MKQYKKALTRVCYKSSKFWFHWDNLKICIHFQLASSRYMRADIYAGQMWLLIILLARHLHAYGELSINHCERRLKVFFFSDNHLAFPSHVQILHAFIIQIFLWSLLGLAEKIVIQIWKLFKTREVTRRGWSGTEVVSECSIKYSFKPHNENEFFGGKKVCRVAAVA